MGKFKDKAIFKVDGINLITCKLLPTTAAQDKELLTGNVSGAIEQNLSTVIKTMVN